MFTHMLNFIFICTHFSDSIDFLFLVSSFEFWNKTVDAAASSWDLEHPKNIAQPKNFLNSISIPSWLLNEMSLLKITFSVYSWTIARLNNQCMTKKKRRCMNARICAAVVVKPWVKDFLFHKWLELHSSFDNYRNKIWIDDTSHLQLKMHSFRKTEISISRFLVAITLNLFIQLIL